DALARHPRLHDGGEQEAHDEGPPDLPGHEEGVLQRVGDDVEHRAALYGPGVSVQREVHRHPRPAVLPVLDAQALGELDDDQQARAHAGAVGAWMPAAAVGALAAAPAPALADGDPASDFLLQQDSFYPYAPKTSGAMRKALDGLLKRTRQAGYPMKVALIESRSDLGAYPNLFSDPQRY